MELTVDNDPPCAAPEPPRLAALLRGLAVEQVVVLESAELTFVTAVRLDDGYLLEYQEGDVERHYECPGGATLDEVVDVFAAYRRGEDAWRTRVAWRHLPPGPPPVAAPPPWPLWARAVRAVGLVTAATVGAACCGQEYGLVIGPIAGALTALLLWLMWRSDRADR